jgi:hypothetical protein
MIRILAAQLTAAFAALAFTLIAAPAGAQTLVHNINGYTIGADGRVTRFTALEMARTDGSGS